jgi:DNA polymerase-3 subunit epsilon
MTRGQESLIMEIDATAPPVLQAGLAAQRPPLLVLRASADELAEHEKVLAEIGKESKGNCIWPVSGG